MGDEVFDRIDELIQAADRKRWAEDQRKLLDRRRRIKSGRMPPARPLAKVLELRRTAS